MPRKPLPKLNYPSDLGNKFWIRTCMCLEEAVIPRSVKGRRYPSQGMRDCKIRFAAVTCCIFGTKDYILILLKRLGDHF